MNAQLNRNIFGYKEFCIKADQNPKRRSLFMLGYQESFFSEEEIQVSSTLGIVHKMTVPTIIHNGLHSVNIKISWGAPICEIVIQWIITLSLQPKDGIWWRPISWKLIKMVKILQETLWWRSFKGEIIFHIGLPSNYLTKVLVVKQDFP